MTASMSTVRGDHTATLLRNGTVLVVGGYVDSGRVLASAEVYDPRTGRWTLTGRMHTARSGHLAALLPDGRVLVVGGDCCGSAELYDPRQGTWSWASPLPGATPRTSPRPGARPPLGGVTAPAPSRASPWRTPPPPPPEVSSLTVLPNGRVLVLGEFLTAGPSVPQAATRGKAWRFVPQAALYAPRTNRWTSIGRVPLAGTATLLATGNVLVVGSAKTVGPPVPSAVLYHPRTGSWTPTGHPHIPLGSVVRLANGKVLVTGGFGPAGPLSLFTSQSPILTDAELYDPRTGQWAATGPLLTGRQAPAVALLPDGKVLFAGGYNGANLSSAEVYNPRTGTWSPTGSMATVRFGPTATVLPDGRVLVSGGQGWPGLLASAELYIGS